MKRVKPKPPDSAKIVVTFVSGDGRRRTIAEFPLMASEVETTVPESKKRRSTRTADAE